MKLTYSVFHFEAFYFLFPIVNLIQKLFLSSTDFTILLKKIKPLVTHSMVSINHLHFTKLWPMHLMRVIQQFSPSFTSVDIATKLYTIFRLYQYHQCMNYQISSLIIKYDNEQYVVCTLFPWLPSSKIQMSKHKYTCIIKERISMSL